MPVAARRKAIHLTDFEEVGLWGPDHVGTSPHLCAEEAPTRRVISSITSLSLRARSLLSIARHGFAPVAARPLLRSAPRSPRREHPTPRHETKGFAMNGHLAHAGCYRCQRWSM